MPCTESVKGDRHTTGRWQAGGEEGFCCTSLGQAQGAVRVFIGVFRVRVAGLQALAIQEALGLTVSMYCFGPGDG